MGSAAQGYDADTTGSRPGLALALQYYKSDGSTQSTTKFDGYEILRVIR